MDTRGQTSLNVGSGVKRAGGDAAVDPSPGPVSNPAKQAYFYDWTFQHGPSTGGPATGSRRWFGPSSAHAGGIVLHGCGDGHGRGVYESIDRQVYLGLVTRAGGEVLPEGP
jgi:hypothetical protein